MKTILITGINGYLGSHLAKALSPEYNIVGLEYKLDNLFRIENLGYKVYSNNDVNIANIFSEQHIDIIVHTATFYGKENEDIVSIYNSNLNSPFKLLDQAIKSRCKLFINTDTVLDRFVNSYSLTKRQFQEWLYIRKTEINVINLQLEHFFGPGASDSNFIASMIKRLKNNEQKIDLTFGEQQRDFIYIEDVINAYLVIIGKQNLFKDNFLSFQVCTNQLISIKDLMILLKDITGSKSILNFGAVSYRENELMKSITNNSALISIGWKPIYSITEGLKLTCFNN